ncbi:hypothetical protein HDU98_000118 [Podochytrium sp. JEL0797]|nr:hypothetical protein HDU98_000118 [Podochytrium sp. JEL0797]
MKQHGSIPYTTQSGRDAMELSDSILTYLNRHGGVDSSSATLPKTDSESAAGVQKLLQGIHVGGVATREEMVGAKAIGGVPECLSRVKWGAMAVDGASISRGDSGFFGHPKLVASDSTDARMETDVSEDVVMEG